SPVRVPRDESGQCVLRGVYPCGEGCGYAGGIVSAAVDGVRTAEAVCSNEQ
ncbi:MAG: FAD-dependent oxidoreductase, partial [Clostridiales bacterium]|nr:FAD-dependent oxidoreductase [Clostridiales bacterium]